MSEKEKKVKDGRKCSVFIPREQATKLTLQEAIDLAMERTKKTNNEMLFLYDSDTKKVLSSITEGECGGVQEPYQEWGIKANASFHTHGRQIQA